MTRSGPPIWQPARHERARDAAAHQPGAESRAASALAVVKGQDSGRFTDFYHGMLTASWPVFIAQLAAMFITVNLVFAMLYVIDRGGIVNARPGSFADAFFFSVQTLGTLGYGAMAPRSLYANLLVTAESFTGILIIALFTGIIFARFSRPLRGWCSAEVAVVTHLRRRPHPDVPHRQPARQFHSGCRDQSCRWPANTPPAKASACAASRN